MRRGARVRARGSSCLAYLSCLSLPSARHLAISPDEIGKLVLFVVATVAGLFVQQRVRAQPQAGDQRARLAVGRRLPPEPGPGEGGVRVSNTRVG